MPVQLVNIRFPRINAPTKALRDWAEEIREAFLDRALEKNLDQLVAAYEEGGECMEKEQENYDLIRRCLEASCAKFPDAGWWVFNEKELKRLLIPVYREVKKAVEEYD